MSDDIVVCIVMNDQTSPFKTEVAHARYYLTWYLQWVLWLIESQFDINLTKVSLVKFFNF